MSKPKFKVGEKVVCISKEFGNFGRVFIVQSIEERESVVDQAYHGVYELLLRTIDGKDPTHYNSEKYYRPITPLEELL